MPTFFSLTPSEAANYRHNLFTQIHEIVFYGKGGYDWHTIYGMPIWLRKFTLKQLTDHYKAKQDAQSGTSSNDMEKGRDILKQAQRADPSNARKAGYMEKFPKINKSNTSSQRINTPDFVTTKAKKA